MALSLRYRRLLPLREKEARRKGQLPRKNWQPYIVRRILSRDLLIARLVRSRLKLQVEQGRQREPG